MTAIEMPIPFTGPTTRYSLTIKWADGMNTNHDVDSFHILSGEQSDERGRPLPANPSKQSTLLINLAEVRCITVTDRNA